MKKDETVANMLYLRKNFVSLQRYKVSHETGDIKEQQ